MRRWAPPLVILIAALAVALYSQQTRSVKRSGYPAPSFRLTDLSGREYRLAELRGKIVFLNVWATWCPPCRDEMPSMETLYRRLAGEDFVMLAVSEDAQGAQAVAPFVRELGLTFPILLDPDGIIPRKYGVTGYPETFVIDRAGRVIQHIIGPEDWASEQVYMYFRRLIEQPLESPVG
jgi:peroxiredoxin